MAGWLALLPGGVAATAEPPRQPSDDATVHRRFDDAEHWAQRFEDPARDAWQRPAEVIQALAIEPGHRVADVGAGTGYFVPHLAAAVGPSGRVWAVDIEPEMVAHLERRAREGGLTQVRAVLAEPADPRLPVGEVDLVLLVNTYHHLDDRVDYFRRLIRALAPGGRLAVIDFSPDRPSSPGPPPHRRLAAEAVESELAAAGWRLERQADILPAQYLLIFVPAQD